MEFCIKSRRCSLVSTKESNWRLSKRIATTRVWWLLLTEKNEIKTVFVMFARFTVLRSNDAFMSRVDVFANICEPCSVV